MRLDFHVARVAGKTLDGQPTRLPLAYATHVMSSWKPMAKTFKGTIGEPGRVLLHQAADDEVDADGGRRTGARSS